MKNSKAKFQSQESLALRFMREKRKMSLLEVGKKIGIKPKDIDYMENGKRVITDDEMALFLEVYNFSEELFLEIMEIKPLTKQAVNHFFLQRKIY